jgi:hypothetical protein
VHLDDFLKNLFRIDTKALYNLISTTANEVFISGVGGKEMAYVRKVPTMNIILSIPIFYKTLTD